MESHQRRGQGRSDRRNYKRVGITTYRCPSDASAETSCIRTSGRPVETASARVTDGAVSGRLFHGQAHNRAPIALCHSAMVSPGESVESNHKLPSVRFQRAHCPAVVQKELKFSPVTALRRETSLAVNHLSPASFVGSDDDDDGTRAPRPPPGNAHSLCGRPQSRPSQEFCGSLVAFAMVAGIRSFCSEWM